MTGPLLTSPQSWFGPGKRSFALRLRADSRLAAFADDFERWTVVVLDHDGHEVHGEHVTAKTVRRILARDDPQLTIRYRARARAASWRVELHSAEQGLLSTLTGAC